MIDWGVVAIGRNVPDSSEKQPTMYSLGLSIKIKVWEYSGYFRPK